MPSLIKRCTKYGSSYHIDFRYKGRRIRRSCKTSDRQTAQRICNLIIGKIANGTFNLEEIEEQNRSVKEFISEYIENYSRIEKSAATVNIDKLSLNNLSEFIGGDMTLRSITENDALSLRKHLTTIYNSTTVNIRMRALRAAFNWALGDDRKYIGRNPFAKIKQIKVDKKAIRYLDLAQIKKFFDAINKDGERSKSYGRYTRFLLFTGCRRNEGLDLTWDDIDFQNRWILFEKTKSGEYRNYPMNDELLNLVNEIKDASSDTSPTGRLFDFIPEDASRRFRRFRDKAELPKYLHLHSLRHTNAMLHRARGTHILDIKDLLGHASLSTTQIYTKIAPELLRNVVSKLNFEPLIGS